MKQLNEEEALQRAAAFCASTERCIREVEKKLTAAGTSAETCERIIARLIKDKFIDETRFAGSFANDKLRFNKWGRIRIDYELKKRGIAAGIRSEALSKLDTGLYLEILYNLLKDKKKSVKAENTREAYFKLLRFGAGRGFESQEINRCLQELFKENRDDAME